MPASHREFSSGAFHDAGGAVRLAVRDSRRPPALGYGLAFKVTGSPAVLSPAVRRPGRN
ncbi:hypothetical protein GO611_16260 [Azoarcus communis SWub3 = DSM 12120]|nr:hypothetical protein [Parazoarcus communis SWub3 = DSM 12120]